MESIILLVVAIGAFGALVTGIVLLVLYFRSGRPAPQHREPVVYGNLVQCPECGYMNPLESAACLQCHTPLIHARNSPSSVPPQFLQTYMGDYQQSPPPGSGPQAPAPAASSRPAPPRPSAPPEASPQPPAAPNRPPGMPHAWLEGIEGAMKGRQAVLQQADTLVGRSTVCDVQIYDPKVSRKHFRIRFGNGAFYLQDQQSSRGTVINGERVMAQKLNSGDRIDIGDSSMVFRIAG